MRKSLCLAALALGCSGEDGPESCDIEGLTGTYLLSYEYVSGDCAVPEATLVRLGDPPSNACVNTQPERYSEGGCVIEEKFSCPRQDGGNENYTTVSRQEDEPGDRLSGTITVEALDANGARICSGTFRISFVRQ